MRVLLISPYHSGSHRAWARGYRAHSEHEIRLLTLPGRFWKWRMHGGALTLARRFNADPWLPDVIVATDMLDLTTFLAVTRRRLDPVPAVLYMHENQLTYPLRQVPHYRRRGYQHNARERHYAFINLASMLAADTVWFNSTYHRNAWFRALPRFLNHYPEYRETESIDLLQARTRVMPVGIDLRRLDQNGEAIAQADAPPLIIWNQRWEYDKNPPAFFRALYNVRHLPFRVALCGENFRREPVEFQEAQEKLGDRIVHVGYADPHRYRSLLHEATVTISTAHHEYFGISILETIYCHTLPLLPRRLSYPELIPAPFHAEILYNNYRDLHQKLVTALRDPAAARRRAADLATAAARYDWSRMAPRYDAALADLAAGSESPRRHR